ncbi:urease accessory protein UreE [Flexibacterium corallicola]|uniref:urease accessory protein UreE n=1 Tax=Flexibacterium corallicola TaxID=3037259 RepID=UPI00286FAB6B|nr:urease accessory protein UreE [Pseudovibrio sp. M1P-2-3]
MHVSRDYKRAEEAHGLKVIASMELASHERHLRRKVLIAQSGEEVLVELEHAAALGHGDVLVLEDGRGIRIEAVVEPLFEVKAKDTLHHMQLCWHLGNRHLSAQIEPARILIVRDHVIKDMLEGLGAAVNPVEERFTPVRGAYHKQGHHHAHGHTHE